MRKLFLFLFLAVPLFAQNSRYDSVALGPRGPIPNASVAVCTQPANTTTTPCSPLANLCSSLTDAVCTSPNPITADSLGNYHFYGKPTQGPFTIQLYGPQVAAPVAIPDQTLGGSGSSIAVNSLNNIKFATAATPGTDCGAKINTQDAALGASPGEIWIDLSCGTLWTTAVSLSANHILRFIQGGTYQSAAAITVGNGSGFSGTGRGNVTADNPPTMLQEANGANLPTFIVASGTGIRIENIYIDGNKANNSTAQDGIVASNAKFKMFNVAVDNFKRHNIVLGAATQETKLEEVTSADAGTNNIEIQSGATDLTLLSVSSENAGTYTLHASGTVGGLHITAGDYSNSVVSSSDCIFLDGTAGQVYPVQIVGVQINPCQGNGINGINLSNVTISANTIGQPGQGLVAGHRDAIQVTNNGHVSITGNSIIDGAVTPSMLHCVNITAETHTNEVSGNKCYINNATTALWVTQPNDTFIGNPTENNAGVVAQTNTDGGLIIPKVIGSGTATMTTALIAAGACGTTVTVAATGVLTTDVVETSPNAAVGANPGVLIPWKWATAGNVNFAYCNPTAAGVTPTATTLNWHVSR